MTKACLGTLVLGMLALVCLTAAAFERAPELALESALPVVGMPRGNLSGLTRCGDRWLAVSDRVDDRLYALHETDDSWQAEPEAFDLPERRVSPLPLHLLAGAWIRSLSAQGMDYEAIACDAVGNRYLLSESYLGVLRLPPAGEIEQPGVWMNLGDSFYTQGVEAGLWQQTNAIAEGLALDGNTMWLAAERLARGLVRLQQEQDEAWRCPVAGCVLLAERRYLPAEPFGPGILTERIMSLDFSDVIFWRNRLWTLERNEHQLCRRHPVSAQRERCWSFADTLLSQPHLYPGASFGVAEALHMDDSGVTIGVDNNGRPRADSDTAPWVFRFVLPEDWSEGYRHE